ncbi:MAG: hypothetical protein H0T56_02215, partial [Pseudaminobacter sp.]|nr:hypothetical protein [Pseudaminobacter sp.]
MPLKLVLAVSMVVLAPLAAYAGEPSEIVRSFYMPEVISGMEPEMRASFTDPALGVFEKNDQIADSGEGACIDFALSIDGQDYDQAEIDRTLELDETLSGDEAIGTASFHLFPGQADSRRLIVWTM